MLRIGVGPQSARTPRSVARRAENQSGRSASAFRDEASLTDRVAGYSDRGPRHPAVCLDGRPPPRRNAFDHASVAPPLRLRHNCPAPFKAPQESLHAARLLWSPYGIGQTIIFLPCGFFLLSFFLSFFFSSPNLSGQRLDVCHTSTHGVALVRI